MRDSTARRIVWLAAAGSLVIAPTLALAQRAGQSVTIQYGVVKGGKAVDLKSDAVPKGAVIGGSLGLASAGGRSSNKKARNTIVGIAAGAAIASAARGDTRGMVYEVDMGSGATMQVVTDQREIRTGDCVAIEKVGETANVRRVSPAYCQKENEAAVRAVERESKKDAEECLAAKQQLVDADTEAAAELAARKITLLCND